MTAQVLRFPSKEALRAYAAGEAVPEAVMGGTVRPHVQAFADAVVERFPGVGTIGTYPGHDPSMDLALDIFPRDRAQGGELAEWATRDEVVDRFGVWYHIWWRRIWNRTIGRVWRAMADRGSATQNHEDHCHFSFEPTGSATPTRGGFLSALSDDQQEDLRRETHEIWAALGGFQDTGKNVLARFNAIDRRMDKLELGGGTVDADALAARAAAAVLDGLAARLKA